MDFKPKAHPDCVYAPNPFHECASDCLDKIAKKHSKKQASKILTLPGSFGKRKTESQTQPSVTNTRPYQNRRSVAKTNSPKVQDQSIPPPPALAMKKETKEIVEADKSVLSSMSHEISIDLRGLADSSQTVPLSPNNKNQTIDQQNGKNDTICELSDFNFLSPARSYRNDEKSDDNDADDELNNDENGIELDIESVMSDSCVSVGKYHVNSSVSTILHSIIEKYGDIAANCKLESAAMRSRYLECLCTLMQELGTTPVKQLTEFKVKEMLAVLKDLESVNIDVNWLNSVLKEFSQFLENVDLENERQETLVMSKKHELEIHETDLARIEEEVREVRSRVVATRTELAELETERSRLEKMGFKIDKYKGKLFLDELI